MRVTLVHPGVRYRRFSGELLAEPVDPFGVKSKGLANHVDRDRCPGLLPMGKKHPPVGEGLSHSPADGA